MKVLAISFRQKDLLYSGSRSLIVAPLQCSPAVFVRSCAVGRVFLTVSARFIQSGRASYTLLRPVAHLIPASENHPPTRPAMPPARVGCPLPHSCPCPCLHATADARRPRVPIRDGGGLWGQAVLSATPPDTVSAEMSVSGDRLCFYAAPSPHYWQPKH